MKLELIKFYTYLDNNNYLKEEHKTGQSMSNAIRNFLDNEKAKERCVNCDYAFYHTGVYPCDECHCYSNFKQRG